MDQELLEQLLPANTLGGPRKDDVNSVEPGFNKANFLVGVVVLIAVGASVLIALGLFST